MPAQHFDVLNRAVVSDTQTETHHSGYSVRAPLRRIDGRRLFQQLGLGSVLVIAPRRWGRWGWRRRRWWWRRRREIRVELLRRGPRLLRQPALCGKRLGHPVIRLGDQVGVLRRGIGDAGG